MTEPEDKSVEKRGILKHIGEQTNIEYLSGIEYGLKMGANRDESEIRKYCDYIKNRVEGLNGEGLPHLEHDC